MAKAKGFGKGWHKQPLRHRRARKHGKAGGIYKTDRPLAKKKAFAIQKRVVLKKEILPPLKNKSTRLPLQFSITVPSTKEQHELIEDVEFLKRIKETKTFLTELFGGDTTITGKGEYTSEEGIIRENVAIVEASMLPEDYETHKEKLEKYIQNKQEEWGQKSIAYNFEEDLYIYPAYT